MEVGKKQGIVKALPVLLLAVLFILSLFVGKYPLDLKSLLEKEEYALRIFWTLRFPRTCMAALAGFGLGSVGMIYQILFRNPLASPDIIGVSSGAGAGAAFAILFLPGSPFYITGSAFAGSLLAVLLALGVTMLMPKKGRYTIVLSGMAVHSLAQTALMSLKLTADPEKELASIEYWLMGSFNAVTGKDWKAVMPLVLLCMVVLFFLYRQILLLSIEEEEAALLGVEVFKMRLLVLLVGTLVVAAIICVTGMIGFVGLLAPHCARLVTGNDRILTLWLSGIMGSILLLAADMLARSVAGSELPVSVFTTLMGVPFLLWFMIRNQGLRSNL